MLARSGKAMSHRGGCLAAGVNVDELFVNDPPIDNELDFVPSSILQAEVLHFRTNRDIARCRDQWITHFDVRDGQILSSRFANVQSHELSSFGKPCHLCPTVRRHNGVPGSAAHVGKKTNVGMDQPRVLLLGLCDDLFDLG